MNAQESLGRSPVLGMRIIGSLLYGTTKAVGVTSNELCFLFQEVRHLLPKATNCSFPPLGDFNMQFQHGSSTSFEFDRIQGFLVESKGKASGFDENLVYP